MTRRHLLLSGAAAALLGGCAGPIAKRAAPAGSSTSGLQSAVRTGHRVATPLVGLVVDVPTSAVFETMQAELRTAVPQLQWIYNSRFGGGPSQVPPPSSRPPWWLESGFPNTGSGLAADPNAISLRPALELANFSPPSLVPGALAALGNPDSRSRYLLMPTRLLPLLVRFNVSAFRAAGVSLPRPAWTIDDFTLACTLLHNAITKGKLKALGVDQVLLYPSKGVTLYKQYQTVNLASPLLWETFIVGYGGAIVEGGTAVHWDTGAAFAGISTLMRILRSFAGGPAPKASDQSAVEQRSAMEFVYASYLLPPTGATGPAPGFAPFPRLPVRPAVPSDVQGVQLLYHSGGPTFSWGNPVPPSAAGEEAIAAQIAVRYLTWLYAGPQQALLASAGVPPITVAALGRSAFWHQYGFGGQGVTVQFPYPWPRLADLVLNQGLPALAETYRRDTSSLKGQLRELSEDLTTALAAANVNARCVSLGRENVCLP